MGGRERVHPCERHGKPRLLVYHEQDCPDRMVKREGDTSGKADLEITYSGTCYIKSRRPGSYVKASTGLLETDPPIDVIDDLRDATGL